MFILNIVKIMQTLIYQMEMININEIKENVWKTICSRSKATLHVDIVQHH